MRLHRSLRLGGVTTELALAYREEPGYDTPLLDAIREAARSALCESLLGVRGGIHPVNLTIHGEEALTLLTAVAAHNGARDLQRLPRPPADYRPLPILPVGRPERTPEDPLLSFPGGRFEQDGSFTVESPAPRLPWCHLLANPAFGTLGFRRLSGLHLGSECPGKPPDSLGQRHRFGQPRGAAADAAGRSKRGGGSDPGSQGALWPGLRPIRRGRRSSAHPCDAERTGKGKRQAGGN